MGERRSRAHGQAQLWHALMQQIQDGGGLRHMAETVAGDGNDEMGHGLGGGANSDVIINNPGKPFIMSANRTHNQKIQGIDIMDKTVKLRAYSEPAKSEVAKGNAAADQNLSLELAKKSTLLEEEKKKSLEHLKANEQLRDSFKQEQTKVVELSKKLADLELKTKEFAALEASERAKKDAQLEEEKRKSLEQSKTIEQLRESIKQEQAKAASIANQSAELQAKNKEIEALQAKLKDLNGVINKIASIAEAGKLVVNA